MSPTARILMVLREGGLYLFAASLPFNLWGTQVGLGLATLATLLGWLVAGERIRLPLPLAAPVALYLTAVGLSHLGSGEPLPGLQSALGFWPIVAPFALAAAIRDERVLRNMVIVCVVMAALMGLYGVWQHFSGADWFRVGRRIAREAPGAPGRFLGIGNFETHTTYAFSLAFPLLLALGLGGEGYGGWRGRVGVLLAVVASGAGVVVSYVRSMWLGLGLGAALLAILRRGLALWLAAILAISAGVVVAAVPSLRARAVSIVDPAYNAGRTYIWARSWQMLADHPVNGIGFGNFRHLDDAYFDPAAPAGQVPRTGAHSTYLHLAVETGILGLAAFLWLWVRFFAFARRRLRALVGARRFARGYLSGAMAGVACFLLGSFFQESFFDGEVAFMLWFVVAGAFVVGREPEPLQEVDG